MSIFLLLAFNSAFIVLPHVIAATGGTAASTYFARRPIVGLGFGGATALSAIGLLMPAVVAPAPVGDTPSYLQAAWLVSFGLSSLAVGAVAGSLIVNRDLRNALVHTVIALITILYELR